MQPLRITTLSIALLAGLPLAGAVIAQSAPTAAQQQQLDAARAELDRAAKRYAELAGKYHHADGGPMRIEQRLLRKPVLGVLLAREDSAGVRIAGVTPGSGAADAGLQAGDVLTAIDGARLDAATGSRRYDDAVARLAGLKQDQPVRIDYLRAGKAATASVMPKLDQRVFMRNDADGSLSRFGGPVMIRRGEHGEFDIEADSIEFDGEAFRKHMGQAMGAMSREMPRIQTEILRLGDCEKSGKCRFPMLTEAFRWSGLNLASLDPQLGRYFGTDQGVLVLSTGDELAGLQPGDVVQKIDGKAVDTPRETMAALRAKPAESMVRVDYLRDRKPATAQVKVPEALPFRIPAPPAPPAPPPPPGAASIPPPPAPPVAPGAPGAPHIVERRKVVVIDHNGHRREWEDDGSTPLPAGARRVEKRRMVHVDDNGKTTVLEGDDVPPPPTPPAPPPPPPAPTGD